LRGGGKRRVCTCGCNQIVGRGWSGTSGARLSLKLQNAATIAPTEEGVVRVLRRRIEEKIEVVLGEC